MSTSPGNSSFNAFTPSNLAGIKALFITSLNPIRMPFVAHQIRLLRSKGVEVNILTRTSDHDHAPAAGTLYEGFLDTPVQSSRRAVAALKYAADRLFTPERGRFLTRVSDVRNLGVKTASARLHRWRMIDKELRHWKPDIIHVHFAWHLSAAIPLAEYLGIPIICTAHHSDVYFEEDWPENLANPVVKQIITIAESVNSYILNRAPCLAEKTTLVYNPVNPDFLQPPSTSSRHNRVLNVASFKAIKNQRWLLHAIQSLVSANVDVHCDFVGVGEKLEDCKALALELGIDDRVVFHGFKQHDEVMRLMDSAAAFVLTSESEGLPTVITEALARECPIIATDIPSTRDATRGGRFGELVKLNDTSALAAAIRDVLTAQCSTYAPSEGRNWVSSEFSPSAHWRKLVPVYLAALRS